MDKKTVADLYQTYQRLTHDGTTQGRVDRRTLSHVLGDLPPLLLDRVFTLFATDSQGGPDRFEIDVAKFVCGISPCWGGEEEKKMECESMPASSFFDF